MSKILEQLEKYVDKIVFGIVGIICLAMLWFFVISNPYAAEYRGDKVGPGQFDKQVKLEASGLEDKMEEAPVMPPAHKARAGAYSEKLLCSMDGIDDNIYAPIPGVGDLTPIDDRSYACPDIPEAEEVHAEWYRTVAHVPTDKVDLMNTYKDVATEYGDIDMVSVEGTFDMSKLIGNFTKSFNPSLGGMLAKHRSPELAKPLFAAVSLERQELAGNGWGAWKVVPRSNVDSFRDILSDIPNDMSEVEIGGVELILVNYNSPEVQQAVVQPNGYEFASDIDTWYPPVLHAEYLEITKSERDKERQDSRFKARGGRSRTRNTNQMDMMMDEGMMQGGSNAARARARLERTAAARRGPRTAKDVSLDYDKLLLNDNIELSTHKEPLVLWSHDDTVEPEKTYRYRMRIGVFNPTAGKGWFHGADKDYADQVVLWSDYTEATEEISIDPTIYFFPINLARDKESVSIQVSKFAMGNWQSHEFDVISGQLIGQELEVEPEMNASAMAEMGFEGDFDEYGQTMEPEVVDYSTGALLVDIVDMSDWTGGSSLRVRKYSDILYTLDGTNIKRLPTKKGNWPREMQSKFDTIRVAQEIEVELLARGSGARRKRNMGPGMMDEMMMDEMMMDPMMMAPGRGRR